MRPRSSAGLLLLVTAISSCSWTRFDDLRDEPPVVRIEGPGGIAGFGARLASAPRGQGSVLLVGGDPNTTFPLASYAIANDDPSGSPIDQGYCGELCVSGDSLTPVLAAPAGHQAPCFVFGAGERNASRGLLVRCDDASDLSLAVPGDRSDQPGPMSPDDVIAAALLGDVPGGFILHAASKDTTPLVAAASLAARQAWFYPPGASSPVSLPDPSLVLSDPKEDFGSAIAVLALASGDSIVAVSSPRLNDPNQNGHVFVFLVNHTSLQVQPWGCLSGLRSGFGLYLATGQLSGDKSDDLLVADSDSITVYDGGALAASPLPDQCGAPLISPDAYVASFSCVDGGDIAGCGRTPFSFGRAVAIGDLDGDGANEVLVGMRDLDVDGNAAAGAVLVYRVDRDPARTTIVDTLRLASPSAGDGVGTAVSTVRVGARDVAVAGAPGARSVFLFYCSSLGGAGRDSSRCP